MTIIIITRDNQDDEYDSKSHDNSAKHFRQFCLIQFSIIHFFTATAISIVFKVVQDDS